MFDQLYKTIGALDKNKADGFLSELLGNEEKIMLAKRLATIVLLTENFSLYKTALILKISSATAEKINRKLERGDYDEILKILGKSNKSYFEFLNTLDSILHLGGILPHYNGLDRYKYTR